MGIDFLVGVTQGFLGRMPARCSLTRSNGPFTLAMIAVGTRRLPCGNLPRLLLAWECSEAVRTGRRDLVLEKRPCDFVGRLGINNGGGVPRRQRRDQMERLFGCAVSLHYRGDDRSVRRAGVIAGKAVFCWDDRPDVDSLLPSEIRLSHPFFDSIVRQPIPIDLNCLHVLRRSALGLHLYLWLSCRTFSLTHPFALTWKPVYARHRIFPEEAGDDLTVRNFCKKCLRELKKIKRAWPGLRYTAERGRHIPHSAPAQVSRGRKPDACARALRLLSPLPCCVSLKVTAGRSRLPKSFSRTIRRSGLWLPPDARLTLEPLGRRKPAARTLTLAQRGVCHCLARAALARPCTWLRFVLPLSGLAVAASPG